MRHYYVLARLWWRWIVRWWTGRRFTVPLPDKRKVYVERMMSFLKTVIAEQARRRENNRDLLTGMVIALLHGPNVLPWSGWEMYKGANRPRSHLKKETVYRLVGRPSVMEYAIAPKYRKDGQKKPGPVKGRLGLTEFWQDYVPRREQLAAKGRRKYL